MFIYFEGELLEFNFLYITPLESPKGGGLLSNFSWFEDSFWSYDGKQYRNLNEPKMAYSRDLPKMARQQCGIMDWNYSDTYLEIETGDMVWGGDQMTGEFIHDWHGWMACMNGMDEWHGWLAWMTGTDDWHRWLAWLTDSCL